MERQLLDPVGTESVADVVRRLGAVLSMDESLAELAVRTRRATSRPGELALALADGAEEVRFLPGHDQWVIGPGTKDVHVTPLPRRGLMTRKANPVIVGGVVRGTWARRGDELSVAWLDERARPDEAIERESGRLADLLGRDLRLALTP